MAEKTGMDLLGFAFYRENVNQGGYYNRRYYKSYYHKYDYRINPVGVTEISKANKNKNENGNG